MNGYVIKGETAPGEMAEYIENFFHTEPVEKWIKEVVNWKRTGQFKDADNI